MTDILICIGCNKTPENISEYETYAKMEKITPSQFVRENEPIGCWGKGANTFYCTSCYIRAGMPLRK